MNSEKEIAKDFKYDFDSLSAGQKTLVTGYIDYALSVITNRALPDIRDGLKPVHRHVLWSLKADKIKGMIKSATLAGNTMKYHPHSDEAIYLAFAFLTDINGSFQFPLLKGQGNFSKYYKSDKPAARRYTEVGLLPQTEEYFNEMNGIDMIPNFDASAKEPEVLPVSFPAILVNSTSGIAVGFKANIPSFNFNDVIDLTVEYLQNGECTTVIVPDFVNGGIYIKNNKELQKLMKTGVAKLKLRGKYVIEGKAITAYEFPAGKTIQGLRKQIDKADINYVRATGDVDDISGAGLYIDCTARNRVDDVIYSLYKDTDFQCNFDANITVIRDGEPVQEGVWGIVKDWCAWRRKVLIKEYTTRINTLKVDATEARAFMEVIKDIPKRDEIRRLLDYEGTASAVKYILDNFDNEIVTPDLAQWVVRRGANNFKDGGKYKTLYDEANAKVTSYKHLIDTIDNVIINQLLTLKSKYGANHPRRTEITNNDFEFTTVEEVESKDLTSCVFSLNNGFLRKQKFVSDSQDSEYEIHANASDTLIAIDNRGRVLRVYCEDLLYNSAGEMGTYLPKYFGLDESDDYEIKWIGLLDGSTKMILYKDGNIGFLDTSEWLNIKRQVKVLERGISITSAPYIGAVLDNIPEMLFVTDTEGKLGFEYVSSIKRKDRTAKTRVFTLKKGAMLDSFCGYSLTSGSLVVSDLMRYHAPLLSKIPDYTIDFRGDISDFKMI